MDQLIEKVKNWADEKNLLKEENSHAQMLKVLEEVGETAGAILKKKDQEIIDVSVGFLRHLALIYPFVAIAITSGRIMQGLGKGLPVLLITTVRVLGIGAPLGLYFTFILSKPVEWNWYAMMISGTLAFIIAINWVRYEVSKVNKEIGNI